MELALYGSLIEEVRARRAKGIHRTSLIDQVLDSQAVGNEPLLDDEQVAYIGGVLLEGGSDTTSSLTLSFLLACCAFPEVLVRSKKKLHFAGSCADLDLWLQRKAQAEVDKVCGRGRMPEFDDYDALPYIRMCVKEVQRWRPVVIMSFPHYTTKEERYKDYV